MRAFLVALMLAFPAWAAEYRIDPGASVEGGTLRVEPRVHGAPGARFRYEIRVTREGAGGRSTSSQSGSARLGEDGAAKLAVTSTSVSPKDRYRVSVTLFEGSRIVAEETLRYPR